MGKGYVFLMTITSQFPRKVLGWSRHPLKLLQYGAILSVVDKTGLIIYTKARNYVILVHITLYFCGNLKCLLLQFLFLFIMLKDL